MLVTPGQPSSLAKDKAGLLSAEETGLNEVDIVNYASELVSDAHRDCRPNRFKRIIGTLPTFVQ